MKKLLAIVGFIVLLFTSYSYISAQNEVQSGITLPDIYPNPTNDLPFLGQDHSYTVNFRGNGEAVVWGKFVFTNNTEDKIESTSIRLPKQIEGDIFVYQALNDRYCLRYDYSLNENINNDLYQKPNYPCIEYAPMNQSQFKYGSFKYLKASYQLNDEFLDINFPRPVEVNQVGAYFIYFRTFDFTRKNMFGAYEYNFQSLMTDDEISSLNVGINVDRDLYLRGVSGEINYNLPTTSSNDALKGFSNSESISSTQVDNYYSNIGYGQIHKTASNLTPMESYTVKGTYADSRAKLYAFSVIKYIILAIFVLAIITLLAIGIIKFISKKQFINKKALIVIFVSFASSSVLIVSSIVVFLIFRGLSAGFMRVYYYNSLSTISFFALVALLVLILLFSFFIIVPSWFIGMKFGVKWGIINGMLTFLWPILFLVFLGSGYFIMYFFNSRGGIMPMDGVGSLEKMKY